jgi:transposase-like protein
MAPQPPRRSSPAQAPGPRRQARRFPAAYKQAILQEYASLDRLGRTALLRRENLRASQISRWRSQAGKASMQALSTEPGGQPPRKIHISEPLWNELTQAGAQASPPMTPERLLRALASWYVGRTDRLPAPRRTGPAQDPSPASRISQDQ